MNGTVKIAVVGCGRMGRAFIDAMQADGRYVIAAVSDTSEAARNFARARLPHAAVYPNADTLFADAGAWPGRAVELVEAVSPTRRRCGYSTCWSVTATHERGLRIRHAMPPNLFNCKAALKDRVHTQVDWKCIISRLATPRPRPGGDMSRGERGFTTAHGPPGLDA